MEKQRKELLRLKEENDDKEENEEEIAKEKEK